MLIKLIAIAIFSFFTQMLTLDITNGIKKPCPRPTSKSPKKTKFKFDARNCIKNPAPKNAPKINLEYFLNIFNILVKNIPTKITKKCWRAIRSPIYFGSIKPFSSIFIEKFVGKE